MVRHVAVKRSGSGTIRAWYTRFSAAVGAALRPFLGYLPAANFGRGGLIRSIHCLVTILALVDDLRLWV
jgi:hypothetical protein